MTYWTSCRTLASLLILPNLSRLERVLFFPCWVSLTQRRKATNRCKWWWPWCFQMKLHKRPKSRVFGEGKDNFPGTGPILLHSLAEQKTETAKWSTSGWDDDSLVWMFCSWNSLESLIGMGLSPVVTTKRPWLRHLSQQNLTKVGKVLRPVQFLFFQFSFMFLENTSAIYSTCAKPKTYDGLISFRMIRSLEPH